LFFEVEAHDAVVAGSFGDFGFFADVEAAEGGVGVAADDVGGAVVEGYGLAVDGGG
jgi:hypothetical protein